MSISSNVRARFQKYRAANPRQPRSEIALKAGVNRHWLEKFDQGVIENPTLRNLEAIQAFLDAQAVAGVPAPLLEQPPAGQPRKAQHQEAA